MAVGCWLRPTEGAGFPVGIHSMPTSPPLAPNNACRPPGVTLGFIPWAPQTRGVHPLVGADVGEFLVGVGGGSGHSGGVGLVGRGAVEALGASGPALAAVAATVICVQGGGRSPRGATQRGAGVPQNRGSLPVAHQADPHQVVPGTSVSWGCWASGARATRPVRVASAGGQAVAPIEHARVLGVDVGLGAPVQHLAFLPLLHLLSFLDGGHDGLGEVVVAHRGWVPVPQVGGLPAHPPGRHHWAVGGGDLVPLHVRFPDVAHFGGQVGRVEPDGGHATMGHALTGRGRRDAGVEQAVIRQAAIAVGERVGRKDVLVRGGGDGLRLQGGELALLQPTGARLQAEGVRVDGVSVQLQGRGLEGAVERSVGVLGQVKVGLRSVVVTAYALFQDGRALPLVWHDDLSSRQQNDTSNVEIGFVLIAPGNMVTLLILVKQSQRIYFLHKCQTKDAVPFLRQCGSGL